MSDCNSIRERSKFLAFAYGADYEYTLPNYYYKILKNGVVDTEKVRNVRLISLGLMSFNLVMTTDISFLSELTSWGVTLTFICLFITVRQADNPDLKNDYGKLALLHILSEAVLLLNVVITLVYWTLLYRLYADFYDRIIEKVNQVTIHVFPLAFTLLNMRVTQVVLLRHHWVFFVPLSMIYMVINYIATKISGFYIYFFLHWENFSSLIVCVALLAFQSVLWLLVVRLSKWLDPVI